MSAANSSPWPVSLPVIGLLGGVASGKSLVARQLVQLGAGLLDADRAGHEVLRLPEVETAARARWGDDIFGPDGRIIRSELAKRVFGPVESNKDHGRLIDRAVPMNRPALIDYAAELTYLESLTHPRIGENLLKQAAEFAQQGRCPALVLDAPVMLKAGWHKGCDWLLFVFAPLHVRLERALQRGWTSEDFARREAAQEPVAQKQQLSDWTIDNSSTSEKTLQQLEQIWGKLCQKRNQAADMRQ